MIAFILSKENDKLKIFAIRSGKSRDSNLSRGSPFSDPCSKVTTIFCNHDSLSRGPPWSQNQNEKI